MKRQILNILKSVCYVSNFYVQVWFSNIINAVLQTDLTIETFRGLVKSNHKKYEIILEEEGKDGKGMN